jgi:hypothetical protein
VDAGCVRQSARCQRAPLGKGPVEAENVADVDREEIEGADRVHEQPFDERVPPLRRVGLHQPDRLIRRDLMSAMSRAIRIPSHAGRKIT